MDKPVQMTGGILAMVCEVGDGCRTPTLKAVVMPWGPVPCCVQCAQRAGHRNLVGIEMKR